MSPVVTPNIRKLAPSAMPAVGHASSQSEDEDLKQREYRDKEGNIHHHTHTAGKKEGEK